MNWQSAGGAVGIVETTAYGQRNAAQRMLHAHSTPVRQMLFDPHADNVLATASDAGDVKIWKLGETTGELSDAAAVLGSHMRRVDSLSWHPSASGILLSGSLDKTVRLWDVESAAAQTSFAGFGESITVRSRSPVCAR